MKVLVTGSTGFIGNYVVKELLSKGVQVISSSRSRAAAEKLEWFGKTEHITFDINNSENSNIDLYAYFKQPDKVIHLAWEDVSRPKELVHLEKNLKSNYYFLKKLIQTGIKDVTVIGTCLEYGMQSGCLGESLPADPVCPYAIAKDTLRRLLDAFNFTSGFSFKWIRLFYAYGKGQAEKSLFSQLEKAIDNGDEDFKMSGGEQVRDFLKVEDAARYICLLALLNSFSGIVNCCSGKPQKVKSFVEKFFDEKNKKVKLSLGFYPYPDYEPMEFWGDAGKLNALLSGAINR